MERRRFLQVALGAIGALATGITFKRDDEWQTTHWKEPVANDRMYSKLFTETLDYMRPQLVDNIHNQIPFLWFMANGSVIEGVPDGETFVSEGSAGGDGGVVRGTIHARFRVTNRRKIGILYGVSPGRS